MNPFKLVAITSLMFGAKLSQILAQEDSSLGVTNGDDTDITPVLTNDFDTHQSKIEIFSENTGELDKKELPEYLDNEEFSEEFYNEEDADVRRQLDHNGAHSGRRLNHQSSEVAEDADIKTHSDHNGAHGRRLMIIGPDNRVQYTPYDFQRGVGLLQTSTKNCTATLIGREYITTAASCVFQDSVVKGKKIRSLPEDLYVTAVFHFGFDNGAPSKFNSGLRKVYADPAYANLKSNAEQKNAVVISLKEAIGQVTHSMQVTPISPASKYNNLGVSAVGFFFNSNTTAGADYCCKIIGSLNAGQVKHLCDVATYGGLGAPLYQQLVKNVDGVQTITYSLVAVHNGEDPAKGYNLAAKSAVVDQLFKVAKKDNKPVAPPYTGIPWDTTQTEIDCAVTPTKKPTPRPTKYPTRPTLSPTPPTKAPTPPTNAPTPPTKAPTPPTNAPTPPTNAPTPPTNAPTPPTNAPTPPTNAPTPPTKAPTPPTNAPTPPTKAPTPPTNAPTQPTNAPTPPTNAPTPPTKAPTPPTKAPTPPTNAPTPPTNAPTPPTKAPTPPTNAPTPPTKAPTPPTNAPTPPTKAPTPPTKAPTPPTKSPTPDCPTGKVRCKDKNNPNYDECIDDTPSPTKYPTNQPIAPTPPTNAPTPPTKAPTPPTKAPTPPTNAPVSTTKAPTPPTKSPTPDCPTGKVRCKDKNNPKYDECIDDTPSPTMFPTNFPTNPPTKPPTWWWGRRLSEVLGYETVEDAVEAVESTAPKSRLRARM